MFFNLRLTTEFFVNIFMNIAILGTGMVGAALGTKLVQGGQNVMMGSRSANSEGAQKWLQSAGGNAQTGTFAQAAAFGGIVLDCTNGANSLDALRLAGADNLRHKILIQVGNPLDFSKGAPPSLTVCNTDSLAEQTQREFPETRVVKALNTINCEVMINPARVPGESCAAYLRQ
jgi:8-hydroxy-5-deazaflavin:NADPH oxidoreductase